MVKIEKCSFCRTAKQKCTPEERRWDPPAVQDRCTNCIKWNKPCSKNEKPPNRQPQEVGKGVLESNLSPAAGLRIAFETIREDMRSSPGSAKRKQTNLTSNSKEQMKRLELLEAMAQFMNNSQGIIMKDGEDGGLGYIAAGYSPKFADLTKFQEAVTEYLVRMIHDVEIFADQADASGEILLAENTYLKILDIYQRLLPQFSRSIADLLFKLSSFYMRSNRPVQAQKCWKDILKTLGPNSEAHCLKQQALEKLHLTLPMTSRIISEAFQSQKSFGLNLETPFPPLHTMMKVAYASKGFCEKVDNDSFIGNTTASTAYSMINPNVENLAGLIRRTANEGLGLESRDILGRTPLFFAASMKQEDVGYALVERMAKLPSADQERHMNARNFIGQTVLGAATEAGCSSAFVKALIERGAEVDPDPLAQIPLTPLQAACITCNVELVKLFLEHDASIHRVSDGHSSPLELAKLSGREIARLIVEHAKPHNKTTAATPAVEDGPYARIDASRYNLFDEYPSSWEDRITENDLVTGSS